MLSDQDRQFLTKHKVKILSALAFIIFGVLMMAVGFFKTMFIVLLAIAGWFFGKIAGDRELIRGFLKNYLDK